MAGDFKKAMSSKKRVVILGSTGSIGESALKVARDIPERMEVIGLAAGRSAQSLLAQATEFKPRAVALYDTTELGTIRGQLPAGTACHGGPEGLIELATMPEADMVLVSIVGTAGLAPALAAIRAGKDIAVASKEILVMAGEEVTREAAKHKVAILPVDSEHNAIFQCLVGEPSRHIRRLILTASGGPFRKTPASELSKVTPAQALKHPTWNMGRKITIDSATLFNKGLEMIEARWLFDIEMARVGVVVHPQSIVHSMVEFVDGSLIAQLSTPDMCLPIQYALTYPARAASDRVQTSFPKIGTLTFEEPDTDRFPAILLARRAGDTCGTMPAVFNAANEVAVDAFINRRINFPQITETVRRVMDAHQVLDHPTLEKILEADAWARKEAAEI